MDETFNPNTNVGPNPESITFPQQNKFMADVRAHIVGEQQLRVVDAAEQVKKYHGATGAPGQYSNIASTAESDYRVAPGTLVTLRDTHAALSLIIFERGDEIENHKGVFFAVRKELVIDEEEADPDSEDQTPVRFPEVVSAVTCVDRDFQIVSKPEDVNLPVTIDDVTAFGLNGDAEAFAVHELGEKLNGNAVFSAAWLPVADRILAKCNPENLIR